jgi:hypothetical protein
LRLVKYRAFHGAIITDSFFFQTGKNLEKFRKIYFSVDFLSFLYYIKILNGAGKFIFRCCPRGKRLFAHASQGRYYYRTSVVSKAKKNEFPDRPPGQ